MIRWAKRLCMFAAGVSLVGAIVYGFLPQPVSVDVGRASRGALSVTIDEDGKTQLRDHRYYIVSAPVAGRLHRVTLRPGNPVKAAETLLATLEPVQPGLLDARALAQAELRVKTAELALHQSTPALERARVSLEFAQQEHDRLQKLRERKATTQQEIENAQMLLLTRTEEAKTAKFAEEIARYELEHARAALMWTRPPSENPEQQSQFVLRAPIDGRVLHVLQESEAVIAAGTQIVELGNPEDLEVQVDVLSTDAVKIVPGNRVLFEHWGGESALEGRVRLVEPSGFTKVSALGVEEQRVYVIVDFVDPPEKRATLGDGFRVEARIVIWEQPDVLKVPTSALFRHQDDWAVYLIEQNRAALRPVKIGHRTGLEAELLEGLHEGQKVIVHPSDKIKPGVALQFR